MVALEEWIVILLILSTLLACWSFSLLLRLVSEFVARKRKRLRAEHRRKGVVMALVAMWLGLVGSVTAGWFAVRIANQTNTDEVGEPEIVFAVSAGLVLFALMLLVWAIIGDRSRGRLRCPRCWYDMEGIDTPQCPECGKAIRSERHLRKARRMKWPFALASLLIGFAAYGFVHLESVEETDSFALMPTWVLMLGWDVLPEDWILSENSTLGPTLERRLREEYIVGVGERRRERFLERLAKGLEGDFYDRWNPRRAVLIEKHLSNSDEDCWQIFTGLQLSKILLRSAEDLYYAVENRGNSDNDSRVYTVLECPKSAWPFSVSVRAGVVPGIIQEVDELEARSNTDGFEYYWEFSKLFSERSIKYTRKNLQPLHNKVDPTILYDSFIHGDVASHQSNEIIGALNLHLTMFQLAMQLEADLSDPEIYRTLEQNSYNCVFSDLSIEDASVFHDLLDTLTQEDDVFSISLGLRALDVSVQFNRDGMRYQRMAESVRQLDSQLHEDDRDHLVHRDDRDIPISIIVLGLQLALNKEDSSLLQRADEYLRWAGRGPDVRWYEDEDTDRIAAEWLSVFEWCFEHPDPKIREWAYWRIPVTTTSCLSPADERVIKLAQGLVDPDEDARRYAEIIADVSNDPTLHELLEYVRPGYFELRWD